MQPSNIGTFCAKLIVALQSGLVSRSRLCKVAAAELWQNQDKWEALVAAQSELTHPFKTLQRFLRINGQTGGNVNGVKARGAAWAVFQGELGVVDETVLREALLTVTCDWIEPVHYTPLPQRQAETFAGWDPELQAVLRDHADRIKEERPTAFAADHIAWSPSLWLAALQEWLVETLTLLPTDRPLEASLLPRNWTTEQEKRLSQLREIFAWLAQAPTAYTTNLVANAPRTRLLGSFTERLKAATHFLNEVARTEFTWVVDYHTGTNGTRVGTYTLKSSLPPDHPRSRYRLILPCPELRAYLENLAGVPEALFFQDQNKGRHYLEGVLVQLLLRLATTLDHGPDSLACLATLELLAAPKPAVTQGLLWNLILNRLKVPIALIQQVITQLNARWGTHYLLRASNSGVMVERQKELPEGVRQHLSSSGIGRPTEGATAAEPSLQTISTPELLSLLRDMVAFLDRGCSFRDFTVAFTLKVCSHMLDLLTLSQTVPALDAPVKTILYVSQLLNKQNGGRRQALAEIHAAVKVVLAHFEKGGDAKIPSVPFGPRFLQELQSLEVEAKMDIRHTGTLENDPRLLQRCIALWIDQHRDFSGDPATIRAITAHYAELFAWLAGEPMTVSRSILDRLRSSRDNPAPLDTGTIKKMVARVNQETHSDFVLDYVYEPHPEDPKQFCEGNAIRYRGQDSSSDQARQARLAAAYGRLKARRGQEAPPPAMTADFKLVKAFEKKLPSQTLRELLIGASRTEAAPLMSGAQQFRSGLAQALAGLTPFGRDLSAPERSKRLAAWAAVIEIFSDADFPVSVGVFWKTELRARGFGVPQYRAVLAAIEARWATRYEIGPQTTIRIRRVAAQSRMLREIFQTGVADLMETVEPCSNERLDLGTALRGLRDGLVRVRGRAHLIRDFTPRLRPHIRLLHEIKLENPKLIPDCDRILYFISLAARPDTTYSLRRSWEACEALLQSGLLGAVKEQPPKPTQPVPPSVAPALLTKDPSDTFRVGDQVRRAPGDPIGTIRAEMVIPIGGHPLPAFVIVYQVDTGTWSERVLKTQMGRMGYKKV